VQSKLVKGFPGTKVQLRKIGLGETAATATQHYQQHSCNSKKPWQQISSINTAGVATQQQQQQQLDNSNSESAAATQQQQQLSSSSNTEATATQWQRQHGSFSNAAAATST
jgi:hypothetical protein